MMKDDGENQSEAKDSVTLIAKYGKVQHVLENLPPSTTVLEVKQMLTNATRILPKRQKLIGLICTKGPLSDETPIRLVQTKKKPVKGNELMFILMGTPEEDILVDPSLRDDLPEVIDDFDLDFNAGSAEWLQHVANEENLKTFTEKTKVFIMNEPRESKPLMVLDLDHTLLDFSSKALQREGVGGTLASTAIVKAMKRPYMDSFLTSVYQYYDLVVWSQTSWRWLETKLIELGMLTHAGYKFCFVLDKTSMFSVVSTKRDGTSHVHHVKPLQLIWTKFPRWGSHNTVHLDDLSRNFALNLSSGLRVTAYYRKKKSVGQGANDVELLSLENYLLQLAKSGLSFEHVDFGQWLDVVRGTKSLEGTVKMKSDKKP